MTMSKYVDELAGRLFDYAVGQPTFTNRQAMAGLEIKHLATFNQAARRLRLILGEDDINLVCTPQGEGEPWLYELVGNLENAGPWVRNRLRDLEARIETQHAVSRSLVTATDGRTVEGRKARLFAKTLGRLQEDLAELSDG
jgi:hypothetical protein